MFFGPSPKEHLYIFLVLCLFHRYTLDVVLDCFQMLLGSGLLLSRQILSFCVYRGTNLLFLSCVQLPEESVMLLVYPNQRAPDQIQLFHGGGAE